MHRLGHFQSLLSLDLDPCFGHISKHSISIAGNMHTRTWAAVKSRNVWGEFEANFHTCVHLANCCNKARLDGCFLGSPKIGTAQTIESSFSSLCLWYTCSSMCVRTVWGWQMPHVSCIPLDCILCVSSEIMTTCLHAVKLMNSGESVLRQD